MFIFDKDILEDIYSFYSNRALLKWPRTIHTLLSDIYEEFNIDYKEVLKIHYNIHNTSTKVCNIFTEFVNSSILDNFYIHILNNLNNKDSSYLKLSNLNSFKIYENIYSIIIPDFIFKFIEDHLNIFKNNKDINNILHIIIDSLYIKNNVYLNNYIKKYLLLKLLIETNKDKSSLLNYYNYKRFEYMYKILESNNLKPIAYNPNSSSLYFTIPYSISSKKEQIIERLSNFNNSSIQIQTNEIKYYINSYIGEILKLKRKRTYNSNIIIDNLDFKTPNIIRKIIHSILTIYSNKRYSKPFSYLIGEVFRYNIIPEDYCAKINNNGSYLLVPLNNEWVKLSSKEIRQLSINDIDISLIIDSEYFKKHIDMILKIISQSKLN